MLVNELLYAVLVEALYAVVVAVAVGNNMGVIVGPSAGSRILKEGALTGLSIAGLIIGYFLEGWKLKTVTNLSPYTIFVSFVLALLILALLTLGGFVTSITQVFVGIYIGYLIYAGETSEYSAIINIGVYWVITFSLSVAISYLFMRSMGGKKGNVLITNLLTLKLVSIFLVFLTAYTLGANTIGFIAGFLNPLTNYENLMLITVTGVILGVFMIKGSKGISKLGSSFYGLRYTSAIVPYISTLLLTEIGTQLSVPLPMSISIFSGILGVAAGMKLRLLSSRQVLAYIIISWVIPLFLAIALSYFTFWVLSLA